MPRKASSEGVLIIDDDADIRGILVAALEEQGYRAISAANGLEALELLRILPTPPSAILLDLRMPVMDGRQFCAEQRQDPLLSKIPVVVVSANGNVEEEASQVAASAYLRKPFLIQDLLHTIAKVCSEPELSRQNGMSAERK